MDHGPREDLAHQPFEELGALLARSPGLASRLDRVAQVEEAKARAELERVDIGHHVVRVDNVSDVTPEALPTIISATPEDGRTPPPPGLLGAAARRGNGLAVPTLRARLYRELTCSASCPVCHETTCRQTHEVVFEGMSYWCGSCGYCEPNSTHDACDGKPVRVRITSRVDDPSL